MRPDPAGGGETAFAHRDTQHVHVLAAKFQHSAGTWKNTTWVRDYWSALHPPSSGGAYVNFLKEEGDERIRATYGENYERLAAIKSKYDPTNLFRLNQNIRPRA